MESESVVALRSVPVFVLVYVNGGTEKAVEEVTKLEANTRLVVVMYIICSFISCVVELFIIRIVISNGTKSFCTVDHTCLVARLVACMHVCLLLLTLVELSLTHFLDCVDDGSAGRKRLSCAVLFPSSIRSSSSTWMFWNSMVVSWGVVDSTTSAIVVSCSAGH